MGTLQSVINSLEEYQCDEIAIIRPVRKKDSLDIFKKDIIELQRLKTMTPVSFGGGIRTIEHLNSLNNLPIERLIFSSAFLDENKELIGKAKDLFGHQAIQCLLPLLRKKEELFVYHSSLSDYVPIKEINIEFINELANEIILIDTKNEGKENKFDWSLIDDVPFDWKKIIISGGIGKSCIAEAHKKKLASVLIDNKVLHTEYSISGLKHAIILS
ncbi:putative imidazole glycerol phosphate synthase subunit hisf2 [Aliivibrio fischeri MJ11]|uniref:Imidazole glycerol phosphate synthase subunit hisf2 n=1 Tax=Aliivibrio fischeri (strain MJ11) TaxID=388396 RepID=B5FFW2_ALIFM|nr:putative imidazole glycerol phosphate synthase subunit hisf2 [Aliivibrio fischeri MJ11]